MRAAINEKRMDSASELMSHRAKRPDIEAGLKRAYALQLKRAEKELREKLHEEARMERTKVLQKYAQEIAKAVQVAAPIMDETHRAYLHTLVQNLPEPYRTQIMLADPAVHAHTAGVVVHQGSDTGVVHQGDDDEDSLGVRDADADDDEDSLGFGDADDDDE